MYRSFNASLVAISPKDGEILAMIGSRDYFGESYPKDCDVGLNCKFEPKVNVATYGEGQQPGSAFKPFAYATAFKKGYTPDNIVIDEKLILVNGETKNIFHKITIIAIGDP